MAEHPIQGLMKATLESLKEMVDVNTVVGDPVETQDGQLIIPVSRVSVGFAAGGSEFGNRAGGGGAQDYEDDYGGGQQAGGLPFGGGSGAGVSVQPVGFLVVGRDQIRILPVDQNRQGWDRLVDLAPQVLERLGKRGEDGGRARSDDGGGGRDAGGGQQRRSRGRADRLVRRVSSELTSAEEEEDGGGRYR